MRINIKPLSVNDAWQGKRFKTNNYKQYERDMMFLLPKAKIDFKGNLAIDVTVGFSRKSSDLDNILKPLLDCLQKKYGFDDKYIYEITARKEIVKEGNEFMEIKINEIKE